MKAKRPEAIIITVDQCCDDHDVSALIKNLEASPTVFQYQCAYKGLVVDMRDAINNRNKDTNWSE